MRIKFSFLASPEGAHAINRGKLCLGHVFCAKNDGLNVKSETVKSAILLNRF
jgi:hypothetical protein